MRHEAAEEAMAIHRTPGVPWAPAVSGYRTADSSRGATAAGGGRAQSLESKREDRPGGRSHVQPIGRSKE